MPQTLVKLVDGNLTALMPHLAGTAAAGAVALASVRGDVTKREARLHRFLKSGRNIAAGDAGRRPPKWHDYDQVRGGRQK